MGAEEAVVDVRFEVERVSGFDLVELETAVQTESQGPSATRETALRAQDFAAAVVEGIGFCFLRAMCSRTSF